MEDSKPVQSGGLVPGQQQPCIRATFHAAGSGSPLAIAASDERGQFHALDYAGAPPQFVEIIRTHPGAVRGNHLHRRCIETLCMLSGAIDLYLLCDCPGRHLFRKRLAAGDSVRIFPGTAHAVHALSENDIVSAFSEGDPRQDRERVVLIGV